MVEQEKYTSYLVIVQLGYAEETRCGSLNFHLMSDKELTPKKIRQKFVDDLTFSHNQYRKYYYKDCCKEYLDRGDSIRFCAKCGKKLVRESSVNSEDLIEDLIDTLYKQLHNSLDGSHSMWYEEMEQAGWYTNLTEINNLKSIILIEGMDHFIRNEITDLPIEEIKVG